jgi:molybdopterin-guanine dinucleotide biosynthesis protein A
VGLTAGIERAANPFLAVVAVDLPAITPAWFDSLRNECRLSCGIVARQGDRFEPLAAIYPREIIWLAWEALARAEYSLQNLVTNAIAQGILRVREIKPAEAPLLANWNREEDRNA